MNELLDVFNSRELAALTWLVLFLGFCFRQSQVRDAFRDLIEAFLQKPIFICTLLCSLYVVAICGVLYKNGWWSFANLKTTIFWFISGGLVSVFTVQKAIRQEHFFRDAIKDQLRVSIILEFLVSYYVFNYWVELLIFPVGFYLTAMIACSEGKEEYRVVHNLLTGILALCGFCLVIHGLYKTFSDYHQIINQPQLIEFMLVPLLAVAILPFIYCLALFMTYENLFFRLEYWIKDRDLAKLTKHRLLITFSLNLKQLVAFSNKNSIIRIKNKRDLERLIRPKKKCKISRAHSCSKFEVEKKKALV